MSRKVKIAVSIEQYVNLKIWESDLTQPDLHRRAYAILQIAQGKPIKQVANELTPPVHRNTVQTWVSRFVSQGLRGLANRTTPIKSIPYQQDR